MYLIMNKVLYRNDSAFGDHVYDAEAVIAFEIQKLGNSDSIRYILDHYALSSDLVEKWNGYLHDLEENFSIPMETKEFYEEIRELLDAVADSIGKAPIQKVLWLAEKDSVIQYYSGNEDNMTAYSTKGGLILSDLGSEGVLIGYPSMPKPLDLQSTKKRIQFER